MSLLPRPPFLYPIVDTSVCSSRGLDPQAVAEAYLAGGARVLQLRDKAGASAAFLSLADRMVTSASSRSAVIIVNDRADITRLSGAAGDVPDITGKAMPGVCIPCSNCISSRFER